MNFAVRIAALLFMCMAPARSQAAVIEETNIEGWIVGAYSNNQTGQFSHCATSVGYTTGISLFFHLNRNFTWSMGLANARWRHGAGRTFNLEYYIDTGHRTPVRATVTGTGLVQIPLPDSRSLFEQFRIGQVLYVYDGVETFRFKLTNSAKALGATLDCTSRYARGGQPAPSAALPPPQAAQGDADFRTEATILAANTLSAAAIPGFRLIAREELSTANQRFHAAWTADGGLVGAITIVPLHSAASTDVVAASLLAYDAQECKGAFTSGRYPTQDQTGLGRLMTSCAGINNPYENQYTIARRSAGGFYVIAVTGPGQSSRTILDAGTKLHEIASRGLGRP